MAQASPRTARGEQARRAILDAALQQFSAYGYRRASMEDLARAAGLSRPSLYFHFGSKEELFRALVQRLQDDQLAEAERALMLDASLEDRVLAMLAAQFTHFVALMAGSPHGAEILDENNRVCADINLEARRRGVALLARLLEDPELHLEHHDLDAEGAAELLIACAAGAKDGAVGDPAVYAGRLRRLVGVLLAGLRT
jgi:AcrR family transcriptional regulator